MDDLIEVWITKYALSQGIAHRWARDCGNGMIRVEDGRLGQFFHGEGLEWHRSPSAAVAWFEKMREAKIKSLEKQIAKLRKMTFQADERATPG